MDHSNVWQFRPKRLLAGAICFAYVWIWFQLADAGKPSGLTPWLAYSWAGTMVFAILIGVSLVGNGLGLINSEVLATAGEGRSPTLRTFVAVYFGILLGTSLIATVAAAALHVHWIRAASVTLGALFLFAIGERPWWLYASIRRTGWFALITDELAMRIVLGVIGLFIITLGLVAPIPPDGMP